MPRLEIELFRYRELVFGRILHMDESLRADVDCKKILYSKDGFAVISAVYPQLTQQALFVYGFTREKDSCVLCLNCRTEEEAIQCCEHVKTAVEVINKDAEVTILHSSIVKVL